MKGGNVIIGVLGAALAVGLLIYFIMNFSAAIEGLRFGGSREGVFTLGRTVAVLGGILLGVAACAYGVKSPPQRGRRRPRSRRR